MRQMILSCPADSRSRANLGTWTEPQHGNAIHVQVDIGRGFDARKTFSDSTIKLRTSVGINVGAFKCIASVPGLHTSAESFDTLGMM